MYLIESENPNMNFDNMPAKETMYWRKANAIHNWFVINVQDCKDDCEIYPVTKQQLQQLLNLCTEVLNDYTKAEELLPTTCGFFFGSTDYNDMYFEDLIYTKENLEKILNNDNTKYLYYWSSW